MTFHVDKRSQIDNHGVTFQHPLKDRPGVDSFHFVWNHVPQGDARWSRWSTLVDTQIMEGFPVRCHGSLPPFWWGTEHRGFLVGQVARSCFQCDELSHWGHGFDRCGFRVLWGGGCGVRSVRCAFRVWKSKKLPQTSQQLTSKFQVIQQGLEF